MKTEEYITIKYKDYHIIRVSDVTYTKKEGNNIYVSIDNETTVLTGELVGVFEKYSEAIRATIEQD